MIPKFTHLSVNIITVFFSLFGRNKPKITCCCPASAAHILISLIF